jgi:hypothetical protein
MSSVSGYRAGRWCVYVSGDPKGTLTYNAFLRGVPPPSSVPPVHAQRADHRGLQGHGLEPHLGEAGPG